MSTDHHYCGDELHVMLLLWNHGSPASRDVALDLADQNRVSFARIDASLSLMQREHRENRIGDTPISLEETA